MSAAGHLCTSCTKPTIFFFYLNASQRKTAEQTEKPRMIYSCEFESAAFFPRVDLDLTIERPCVAIRDVVLLTQP